MVSPISRETLMPRIHEECLAMINEAAKGDIDAFKLANIDKLKTYYPFIQVDANPDFSYAGSASGLRIWEKRCAATVSPRSEVCPDADRVYGEAIRI